MTSVLVEHLRHRIERDGPLTVADYMAEALSHPRHGYYTTREPFGVAGDFVTAPEISQVFGELVGLWLADAWLRIGQPSPVALVDLGPGRGTLMGDVWRAAAAVPGFREAAEPWLVETSPRLRDMQQRFLGGAVPVRWADDLGGMPDLPFLLVANELLDALPVHQLERGTDGDWYERRVAWNASRGLVFAPDPHPSPRAVLVPERLRTAPAGTVVEVSPAAISLVSSIAAGIARGGGVALLFDYGPAESSPGPTLQAVREHARTDVLDSPGEADLSAHVDFETLAATAREAGAAVSGPVPQGDFLRGLGVEQRAAVLARATPSRAEEVEGGVRRLIAPEAMGTLFKVLALTRPDFGIPAGFPEAGEGGVSG